MGSRRRRWWVVAIGVGLAGCGGGGGSGDGGGLPAADVTSGRRGSVVTLSLADGEGSVALRPAGDDIMLVLCSPTPTTAPVRVTVNDGTTELPLLPASRRAAVPRHIAQATLPEPLFGRETLDRGRQELGSQRSFYVLNGDTPTVTATLRRRSETSLLYTDDATPVDSFTEADLDDLVEQFDRHLYPTNVAVFGQPSDVDDNGRIILLFTPRVNTRGYGYFYGPDVSGFSGANRADMLYVRVPMPQNGEPYAQQRTALLATLAHELQHLINYNQKVLVHQRPGGEESWLNEGLSFYAEQLNGYLDTEGGSPENVAAWFAAPERYTLFEQSGNYDDGHAGAGYLFVRYLVDRFGGDVAGRLTRSPRIGRANVSEAVGLPFEEIFLDWAAAVYLNGTGLNAEPRYALPGFATRAAYLGGAVQITGPRATVVDAGGGRPAFSASFTSGALRLVRLRNIPSAGAWLRLTAAPAAGLAVQIIRVPRDLDP